MLPPITSYSATVPIINLEIIRPYPRVDRNLLKNQKKENCQENRGFIQILLKKPDCKKLRIEKSLRSKSKKERAKKKKRALKLLSDKNLITKTTRPKKTLGKDKPKRQNKTDENETDYEGESDYNDETDCEDEASSSHISRYEFEGKFLFSHRRDF